MGWAACRCPSVSASGSVFGIRFLSFRFFSLVLGVSTTAKGEWNHQQRHQRETHGPPRGECTWRDVSLLWALRGLNEGALRLAVECAFAR